MFPSFIGLFFLRLASSEQSHSGGALVALFPSLECPHTARGSLLFARSLLVGVSRLVGSGLLCAEGEAQRAAQEATRKRAS